MQGSKTASLGVMTLKRFNRSTFLRSSCDCMSPECDLTIIVEYDKDLEKPTMTFFQQTSLRDDCMSFFGKIKNYYIRIKRAYTILTSGYLTFNSDFIFTGSEHIDNLIAALQEAKQHCEEQEKKVNPI